MRINSAGVASPNKSPNAKSPEKDERKIASVGSSPKKASPAKGGGPPKSKQVGWGSKKVSPDGSQIQLKPDDSVHQKPEVSSPSPDKENDRSSEKKASYPDVWIPNNGTLEELAACARPPIFFEMDKILAHLFTLALICSLKSIVGWKTLQKTVVLRAKYAAQESIRFLL